MLKKSLKKMITILLLASVVATSVPVSSVYAFDDSIIADDEIHDAGEEDAVIEDSILSTDEKVVGNADTSTEEVVFADDFVPNGREYNADANTIIIEVNQGFSYRITSTAPEIKGATEENTTDALMNDFVADKQTAVMVRLPGYNETQAREKLEDYAIVITPAKSKSIIFRKGCDELSYVPYYDHDSDFAGYMAALRLDDGFEQGGYNIYLVDNETNNAVTGRVNINFFKTEKMRILLVPCINYYSASDPENTNACPVNQRRKPVSCDPTLLENLDTKIYNYLMDVYPLSDIEIEWASTGNFADEKYDLATIDGRYYFWEGLCEYQPKGGTEVEKYDKILGFVQYRQGEESTTQGYTCGAPANIITLSDDDMLPTVAHEIAHNYKIGDEYDGGSHNNNLNPAPNGYEGIDIISREKCISDAPCVVSTSPLQLDLGLSVNNGEKFVEKTDTDATGSVVFPSSHAYSYYQNLFKSFMNVNNKVRPVLSFMGSGYDDTPSYWSTPLIWEHLFKESLVKTSGGIMSKNTSNAVAAANVLVYENADDTILTENDLVDELYREGESRLIEVNGIIKYSSASNNAIPTEVKLDPSYSFAGDLSEIEQDELSYYDDQDDAYDMYVLAALDKDGKIITSPVDGEEAKVIFYAGNFNMASCSYPGDTGFNDFAKFSVEAEYPEGTDRFVIYPMSKPGEIKAEIKASNIEPYGNILYADINSAKARVDWVVDEYAIAEDGSQSVDNSNKDNLHVEIYYVPDGDNGPMYKIKEGRNVDFPAADGSGPVETGNWNTVMFDTTDYGWSSDAYVLVAVTNGVNSDYIYSDENNITLGNVKTKIAVNKGKKGSDGYKHFTYTGEEITPSVSIKVYDAEAGKYIKLKANEDYLLSYENNINAGTATVIATGIGNYDGTVKSTFVINPASIKKSKLMTLPDLVYDGTVDKKLIGNDKCKTLTDIEKNMVLKLKGQELNPGSDYIVTYNDNETLPVPSDKPVAVTVKISGKDNYFGTKTIKNAFILYPSADSAKIISENSVVIWNKKDYSFTGKEINPKVASVSIDGQKINPKYYRVVYSNNRKPGTGNITVVGKKGFVGYKNIHFNIGKMNVSELTVKSASGIVYTGATVGKEVKLPVRVYAGKVKLKENKDYTVSYNGILDKPSNGLSKSDMPEVTVTLKDDSEIVQWKNPQWRGGKKTLGKKFTIKKAPFGSRSLVTINMDYISENGIKHYFSKNTESQKLRKFFCVLDTYDLNGDGKGDGISTAVTDENVNMKLYVKGKELDRSKYKVEIQIPKLMKVGRIVITPLDKEYYSGKRTILFLMK